MYAIVESSGRQYQLEPGRFIDVDRVLVEPDSSLVFHQVLMIVDGGESKVGHPYLSGAKVTGRVLAHTRGRKVVVYKMRPKKGTRIKRGHRQQFSRVWIQSIQVDDKVLAEAEFKPKAEPQSQPQREALPVGKAKPGTKKAAVDKAGPKSEAKKGKPSPAPSKAESSSKRTSPSKAAKRPVSKPKADK